MPIFEYLCKDCESRFEAIVYGQSEPACPKCSGANLEQQLSTFAVGAEKRSSPAPSGGCGSCGDPRGPGACSMN